MSVAGMSFEEFEEIALPVRPLLRRLAGRLTKPRGSRSSPRSRADAEDLVQETMTRAFRRWDSFERGGNIEAWLTTILQNAWIDSYHRGARRRQGQQVIADHAWELGEQVAGGDFGRVMPLGSEDVIDAERTVVAVRLAVAALPEPFRQAVTLADLDGYAYKEIAVIMDCKVGTVMSRIYRGRRMLRTLLAERAQDLGIEGAGEA